MDNVTGGYVYFLIYFIMYCWNTEAPSPEDTLYASKH